MPGRGDVLWCCYLVSTCASTESLRKPSRFWWKFLVGLVAFSRLRKCHDAFYMNIPVLIRSAMTNQNSSKRTIRSIVTLATLIFALALLVLPIGHEAKISVNVT